MAKSGQFFSAAIAVMLLLAFATPAYTQDTQETPGQMDVQPASPGTSDVQSESVEKSAAPHHAAKKKSKSASHKHKSKKKKKAHKTAAKKHHAKKKTAKKKTAAHHKKTVKKTAAAKAQNKTDVNEPEKAVEDEKETAMPKGVMLPAAEEPKTSEKKSDAKEPEDNGDEEEKAEPEKKSEAVEPAQPALKKSLLATTKEKAEVVKEKVTAAKDAAKEKVVAAKEKVAAAITAHKTKTAAASSAGGKTVTYTFCLGYDNCTPYRYEAMMHGGSTDARIFKENASGGGWVETKIDPVMESDLGAMARSESGGDVARPLTVTEKARIADHQGKAHVELVSVANEGPAHKDEVKRMMKDNLGIKNADELSAYDPRLAKNGTAVEAANELAAGR